ncbi:MAG: hypothetical protein AB1568_08420 [Thermodesulfobacteriota bacterium]
MAGETEKKVEELLLQGLTRQQVWKRLVGSERPEKLFFLINNSSLPADRGKIGLLNLGMALVLAFLTFKKLLAAMAFGSIDLFLLLSLVVPVINIYVLREILRFRRIGYQFLFVLSLLSVLQPENHHVPELAMLAVLIAASGIAYLHLFPKRGQLDPSLLAAAS